MWYGVVCCVFSSEMALVLACSLCTNALGKNEERRKLFSESSRSVLPSLADNTAKIYGRDVLRDVFAADSKLCRPCLRRHERIMKLKTELQEKEKELMLQVRCLGEVNCVSMTNGASETTLELTPRKLPPSPVEAEQSTPLKRPAQTREAEDLPASKRRAVAFKKSTPVRSTLQRMHPRKGSKKPSPAVPVSVNCAYVCTAVL